MSDDTRDDDALLDDVEKGKPAKRPHALLFLEDPLYADLSLLLLRVVTASLIVHHGLDKLEHVDGFSNNVIAVYFPLLPGPPVFWTYLSAAFELVGSFCVTVGLFTRLASALLAGTMVNAIAFHLMKFRDSRSTRQREPRTPSSRRSPSSASPSTCSSAAPGGLRCGRPGIKNEIDYCIRGAATECTAASSS